MVSLEHREHQEFPDQEEILEFPEPQVNLDHLVIEETSEHRALLVILEIPDHQDHKATLVSRVYRVHEVFQELVELKVHLVETDCQGREAMQDNLVSQVELVLLGRLVTQEHLETAAHLDYVEIQVMLVLLEQLDLQGSRVFKVHLDLLD